MNYVTPELRIANLRAMWEKADATDRHEGALAYQRYHDLLEAIARHYGFPFAETVAAFCALSPNNDYVGNVRSLVSVLAGLRSGDNPGWITVSTYNHNKTRAIAYLKREEKFYSPKRGLKINNFYGNILMPECEHFVTVDGHMYATWVDRDLTMKEAKVTDGEYLLIKRQIQQLARELRLVPCQVQATIWFARKRLTKTLYIPQLDLFHAPDDQWRTMMKVSEIRPYERRAFEGA